MTYPGNTKLPEGMTVDRAAKIMLMILRASLADIVGCEWSREEQALEVARAASVVCGLLFAIRDTADDPKVPDEDVLLIAEMLEEFGDWALGVDE